jgi:dTDP-glucose 4,6-dehydratase
MPKKVLLTGGCGFIGHHTVEHFLKNTDWQITILDGLKYAGDVAKLFDIEGFDSKRVKIYWHDLRSPLMDSLIKRIGKVDYIINMASESDVERSIKEPVSFVQNNILLSLHMLEYARQVLPYKYIQISTDEVYGPCYTHSGYSEWDRHLPSNPYSASKSAQEALTIAYWRTYGVPAIITVTMNNFGERQHPEKLVPKTIKHLLEKKVMPIHAHYENGAWVPGKRTWLHARNHADALMFILQKVNPQFYQEGVVPQPVKLNIAGDKELANDDVVKRIANVMGVKPIYEFIDFHASRPGHDYRYALDGSKLRTAGWVPPINIDESFERTVEWTMKNKDKWL